MASSHRLWQALAVAAPLVTVSLLPVRADARDVVNGQVCDGDASPTVDPSSGKVTWSCRSGGTIVSGDTVEHDAGDAGTGSGGADAGTDAGTSGEGPRKHPVKRPGGPVQSPRQRPGETGK